MGRYVYRLLLYSIRFITLLLKASPINCIQVGYSCNDALNLIYNDYLILISVLSFVNSEKHLTDALLLWLGGNVEHITRDDCIEILQQVN